MDVEVLMKKKKNVAAAYIQSECARTNVPETLRAVLDTLLDPLQGIDDWEAIDWCKWLMAGGCSPDEFTENVRKYDNATTCGLVWTANFVAYRCRTCGISPCMSLCAECFQRGNHKGHDFNMFRSQAGGACDCGDTNVMKEGGFCYLHGPHSQTPENDGPNGAPPDLLCVATAMMPRLVLRLIQHMRANSNSLSGFLGAVQEADKFITMLHDMSSMGAAMRQVMTQALTNPQIYKTLTDLEEIDSNVTSPGYYDFMSRSKQAYEEALVSLPNVETPEEYKDIPSLQKDLVHRTFLEEFVFWTAKFEFPQKVVCLLLNLLPDEDYKEAFTRAFVLHYSRISQLLVQSTDPDMLSNRVVHVSVQLFSNEKLALRMTEQMGLLHVMVLSLRYMMDKITIPNKLHHKERNRHRVVDCGHVVMKDHCYWPLVSDLNNILSHRPVAMRFLEDDGLLRMWFNFQSVFQGMNVNHREMEQHIEFEPTTYYAAFSAELEASASPMWALVSHLRDSSTAHLTRNLLRHCRAELQDWLQAISYEDGHDYQLHAHTDEMQVSFHLPLHRYFSVFLSQGVRNQGLSLQELLPPPSELRAMLHHPLRVQTAFYEIITGLWVRNGLQIKGQAMTYVQCHFCNSMVDADLFLLQVASTNLPHGDFISTVLDKFHVLESLSISSVSNSYLEPDQEVLMMENCLIHLATLGSIRTAIGVSDADLVTLEMTTLLCMADKTHSQLMELMPERCGNSAQSRDFEAVLSKVADYRAPNFESSGNMLQGMYVPKPFVWDTIYDPIYILLRAVHRREFQTSLDRFAEHAKHSGEFKGTGTPWPPYRVPGKAAEQYTDPRHFLHSRVLQGLLFVVFYKAIHTTHISDQLVALSVFLLEMALSVTDAVGPQEMVSQAGPCFGRYDMNFATWYSSDCLFTNLRTEVDSVIVKPTEKDSDSSDENSNEEAMEVESYDGDVEMFDPFEPMYTVPGSPTRSLAIMGPTHGSEGSGAALVPRNRENEVSVLSPGGGPGGAGALIPLPPPTTPALGLVPTRPQLVFLDPPGIRALVTRSLSGSGGRGRSLDEGLGPRHMQVLPSPLKPLLSAQRKELDRSGSVGTPAVSIVVNESMISLLLSLHSKMTSRPDSYVPFWERAEGQRLISEARAGIRNGLELSDRSQTSAGSSSGEPQWAFSHAQLYSLLHPPTGPESRIGDGAFFISKVLDEILAKDAECREHLSESRLRLWPRESEDEEGRARRETREREEKKRRALERRRKLMEDMAQQQHNYTQYVQNSGTDTQPPFMDTHDQDSRSPGNSEDGQMRALEYDCVICNQTGPSTPSNPIGLVILLQASSLLGHRRARNAAPLTLPTTEEGRQTLRAEETMRTHNERRLEELKRQFDDDSWLMAISAGWDGGVHVQTCGHHIHHDCLREYTASLKSQQRQQNISVERGEYFCPLCRQLANSFLPLSSEFGIRKSALVKDRKSGLGEVSPGEERGTEPRIPGCPEGSVALEVLQLLSEYPLPVVHSKMVDAMAKTMEEMTNATSLKHRKVGSSTNTKSILLFVNSIARTNLELEVVLRGGNLVSVPPQPLPSTSLPSPLSASAVSKRSCIVPLLHVLGVHYKILSTDPCLPKTWERLLGIRLMAENAVMTAEREVPLLLRDPSSTLLHLLMNLPMHVDSAYFTSIVQAIYNQVFVQSLCVLSCGLGEREREEWRGRVGGSVTQLPFLLGTLISALSQAPLYLPDSDYGDMDLAFSHLSPTQSAEERAEAEVERLLLPFLRIAALLRHHLYDTPLPFIPCLDQEFRLLATFLTLGQSSDSESAEVKAHDFLDWVSPTPLSTIRTWVDELGCFVGRSQVSARFLVGSGGVGWAQPRLLRLPHDYDLIFQFYHLKACPNCNTVSKDPSLCLVCGALVCMRDSCCKQQNTNVYEASQHATDCGAGTGIFLSVNSSTCIVVRGKRASLWGSVYLDSYGEEDRELKRGKPLFLSEARYSLLQDQWLTHRFDHFSPSKWIFHRDNL